MLRNTSSWVMNSIIGNMHTTILNKNVKTIPSRCKRFLKILADSIFPMIKWRKLHEIFLSQPIVGLLTVSSILGLVPATAWLLFP